MRKLNWMCLLLVLLLLGTVGLQAEAGYEGISGVSLSPDGNAFTTNAGETDTEWYEDGYTVYTGVKDKLREPEAGEHIYEPVRAQSVPVGKWVVKHPHAVCIHNTYPEGNLLYGDSFGKAKCMRKYYSGWFAYCADCGEVIMDALVYMSEDVAEGLTHLDLTKGYYYKCPHCDNLEQGFSPAAHVCRDISANRYFVRYHANFGSGYMGKSVHMVNNATAYEGHEVIPQTKLNLNTYTRAGYEFVGWNTRQDGSGESFEDGAEIYNLSMEENANVILYAQWRKSSSVLKIDPAGGSFQGKKGISQIKGDYGSVYQLNMTELSSPGGFRVSFDTSGGSKVSAITGTMSFLEWNCTQPFHGQLEENQYHYLGTDGSVDRIKATYVLNPITLPEAVKEGYTFGGWFLDEDCTQPVGMPGSEYIPAKDTTLYANWVDLQLVSADNYTANQGKGAVNLAWSQKDGRAKVYRLYQRTDTSDWVQISSAEEKANDYIVSDSIGFSGKSGVYTVPYTGFYTLTLTGAQGGSYGGYMGGKGGKVQGTFYLEAGEKLEYVLGGQAGFADGGAGTTYGNGGGSSRVTGEKGGVLLIAGGGGGASNAGNGGAGGSAMHVTTSSTGQSGESGGGGGYQGGLAGEVERHTHVAACAHVHTGDRDTYGGCYTVTAACGNMELEKVKVSSVFYYGNIDDNGNHILCGRCGSYSCPGHTDIKWGYKCTRCATVYGSSISKCTALTAYDLGCGMKETYICGMKEGEILRVKPAYGGSNYINSDLCINYTEEQGVQSGNGRLLIQAKQVGLIDANYLNGVSAPDLAPPEKISVESVKKNAVGAGEIRVSFARPKDNGTDYYHKAESYSKETNTLICTSNQTGNTLTSGVIGYRYVMNTLPDTTVKEGHALYSEKGESPFLVVESGETERYLHIAPLDGAGNLGPTIHILISKEDVIYWPVMTEKLELLEGSNVHPAGQADTYYVRADGSTPVQLTLEGFLCGTARKEYQINQAFFQTGNLSQGGRGGSLSVVVPNKESIAVGTHTYPMQQLSKRQGGELFLQDASYTVAKRYNTCKNLAVTQKFTLSADCDGQRFQVTPHVAAIGEKETAASDRAADLQNSLYLLADGKGPEIRGAKQLDNLEIIEYSEGKQVAVDIRAADSGSGLAQFYVEIRNRDNGGTLRIEDTTLSGGIHLDISDEEVIFNGAFSITVYASDNVGNETILSSELLGVGLDAYVERVLEPHTPQFKRGESGVLYIETIGYVERLEISFPPGFDLEDTPLSRTIIYDIPNYQKTEEIPFIVPLTIPDGEMTIQIRAYKAGTQLDATPKLLTISVKGSILDELRTRLR